MKFDPGRRRFLKITGAGLAVGIAETLVHSPALAAIREAFKDENKAPDPGNLEAWHTWFLKQEKMFIEAIRNPNVRAILDQPIDENFRAAELGAVMEELLAKWPVAWNDHIRAFTNADPVDKPLQKWVRSGLDKEFPSLDLAFTKSEIEYRSNGTLVNIDGEIMILTAEHVLIGTALKKGQDYWCGEPGDDTAILRALDYFKSRGQRRHPSAPVVPYLPLPARRLAGKRIIVASHDDGVTLRNRINKKIYIGTAVDQTPAITFWRIAHAESGSGLNAHWNHIVSRSTVHERRQAMKNAIRDFNVLITKFPYLQSGGLIMQIPPGESEPDSEGIKPAGGVSGAEVKSEDVIVGVHSSSSPAYVNGRSYSLGVVKTGTGAAIAHYRAWRDSQKLAKN